VPTARLPALDLHYEERGDGPALLLIAGIPAIADDWGPVLDRLSRDRRVIAFDNRGSGRSTVTPGPYTTAQLAADAVALLDHLGVEQADVFGMSLGGMIAQELALARPDRVRALVLGCTHAGLRHAGLRHAAPQPPEAARAFAMRTDDWALRMRTLAPFAFSRDVDSHLLRAFVEKKSRDGQAEEGYRAQIAAVLSHDTVGRLAGVRARTLVITGDDDRIIPAASSLFLQERIPGAALHVIAGAGHLFFLERPDETERALRAFLD
jgi:pimeloyl-ACP methyl ester carboxylesterase